MKKKVVYFCLAGGIILFLILWVRGGDKPPVEEMAHCREVLSEAEKWNAEIYCHQLYEEASVKYESAMLLWKQENECFFLFRSFDSVRIVSSEAAAKGRQAIEKAQSIQQNTRQELQYEIGRLRQEMKDFEKIFMTLPLEPKVIRQHSQGKLLLNEAELAFEKGIYDRGKQKSLEAARLIRASYKSGKKILENYFRHLPLWQEQLKRFIEQSEREKKYVIVIRKIPADCSIYYKGQKKYTFPVEFGKNWLGDKCCEGDGATPEGHYTIVKRLQKPMTRYYKALLLDYPNAEDKIRYEKLKKAGRLPVNARPGGLIEIHGEGGKGVHWTNGCIALENEDMTVLFRYVEKGTPILIIGASEELKSEPDVFES